MSAAVKTIARLGVMAAGVTIAFATMAQSASPTKPAAPVTAAAGAATVTPTPKPGQIVPTSPTPAAAGGMSLPGGPESGAAAGADAAADPVKLAAGKELFVNFSCGSCHSLADAGADGHVGPALDGDKGLNHALVVDRVTNGQGPMPAFAGQMTEEEIQNVASYVVSAAKK